MPKTGGDVDRRQGKAGKPEQVIQAKACNHYPDPHTALTQPARMKLVALPSTHNRAISRLASVTAESKRKSETRLGLRSKRSVVGDDLAHQPRNQGVL
jgi:hypothetical protein